MKPSATPESSGRRAGPPNSLPPPLARCEETISAAVREAKTYIRREPTEAELRAMSWMAIIEGAKGLLYWSFGEKGLAWVKDPREREQRWAELVRVTKEIKALEPVLLAPDAGVVSRESSQGAVRTLGKAGPDGARYLFAYNTRKTPSKVTWTLGAPATETFDLATGKAGPAVENGALTAELGPYEVRRLRIR